MFVMQWNEFLKPSKAKLFLFVLIIAFYFFYSMVLWKPCAQALYMFREFGADAANPETVSFCMKAEPIITVYTLLLFWPFSLMLFAIPVQYDFPEQLSIIMLLLGLAANIAWLYFIACGISYLLKKIRK